MPQFTIAEAKEKFSEILEKVTLREDVTITENNKPVAKIVALKATRRKPGTGKGKILYISPDFDAPLEDFAEYQ